MSNDNHISILTDIKQSLDGIPEEDTEFDQNVLLHINSALSRLNHLGAISDGGIIIVDSSTTWDDIVPNTVMQGLVRQFVLCSVKIGFDPPTSSFVLNSLEEMRKELAFSVVVEHDHMENTNGV